MCTLHSSQVWLVDLKDPPGARFHEYGEVARNHSVLRVVEGSISTSSPPREGKCQKNRLWRLRRLDEETCDNTQREKIHAADLMLALLHHRPPLPPALPISHSPPHDWASPLDREVPHPTWYPTWLSSRNRRGVPREVSRWATQSLKCKACDGKTPSSRPYSLQAVNKSVLYLA